MTAALSLQEVRFFYGPKEVLSGVGIELQKGESFALLGPNGSGKSTLLRILCTLLPIKSGKAEVFGLDVSTEPTRVREQIGVVFQSSTTDPYLSVKENLYVQGLLHAMSFHEIEKSISEMLRLFDLEQWGDSRVATLSGGTRRRVELAGALLHRPPLLLMDEPTAGLDPENRAEFLAAVAKLIREKGTTIFFSTHLFEEAEACSKAGLLAGGKLAAAGTSAELKNRAGHAMIQINTPLASNLVHEVERVTGTDAHSSGDTIRISCPSDESAAKILALVTGHFQNSVESITLRKPTLEDIYLQVVEESREQKK